MQFYAGLYLRLSKEDGNGESASISTQRNFLLSYAKEKGYLVKEIYIDDGYTGTNFQRPGFEKMLQDIENGKINLVLIKDLSRLGRDYIQTGQYTELYFPEKKVRLIAVNDGYDSENRNDDLIPFRNMINEMYARDISKKIRSALDTKRKQGEYIANFAPYGYQKDPKNKNHLIPDEKAAEVVKRIFSLADFGNSPGKIADILNKEHVLTPLDYRHKEENQNFSFHLWSPGSVRRILRNETYLGHTVQGKTKKLSFKSKVLEPVSKENWVIAENTHQALIEELTFQRVQKNLTVIFRKKREENSLEQEKMADFIFCQDCGKRMTLTYEKGNKKKFVCSSYKSQGKKRCSNHFIEAEELYRVIKERLKQDCSAFLLEKKRNSLEERKWKKKRDEMNFVLSRLYQDYYLGKIEQNRFQMLLTKYEAGQKEIEFHLKQEQAGEISCLVEDWIERIEIGQGKWYFEQGEKKKRQEIHIFYRFKEKKES